jgi:hypothetical protein
MRKNDIKTGTRTDFKIRVSRRITETIPILNIQITSKSMMKKVTKNFIFIFWHKYKKALTMFPRMYSENKNKKEICDNAQKKNTFYDALKSALFRLQKKNSRGD